MADNPSTRLQQWARLLEERKWLSTVALPGVVGTINGNPAISLSRDANEINSAIVANLVGVELRQGFCVDEVNGKIYSLHLSSGSPETSFIAQYRGDRNTAQNPLAVSNASAAIGHQGLAIEHKPGGISKLWSSVRQEATALPNGHRQAMRFAFSGQAADVSEIEYFTLFGPEFSFLTNSCMPAISYDHRFLVAVGRKSSRAFTVRVWSLAEINALGPGDISNKAIAEWTINEDILTADGGGAETPVQDIACDGELIYVLAGTSALQNKKIHAYSLNGVRVDRNDNVRVGIAQATADGTYFEPEGITIFRPAGSAKPVIGLLIVTGPGNAHKNYIWALGEGNSRPGKWTPTATLITNAAAATPGAAHFIKVGSEVSFAGRITIDPTATGLVVVELTLPIPSDFQSVVDAAGTFNAVATPDCGGIEPNIANNTLSLSFIATDTANRAFYYTGMYQII